MLIYLYMYRQTDLPLFQSVLALRSDCFSFRSENLRFKNILCSTRIQEKRVKHENRLRLVRSLLLYIFSSKKFRIFYLLFVQFEYWIALIFKLAPIISANQQMIHAIRNECNVHFPYLFSLNDIIQFG